MTATELLTTLRSAGFVLAVAAGKIRWTGPRTLTAEDLAGLKPELIALLEAEEIERCQLVAAADLVTPTTVVTDADGRVITPQAASRPDPVSVSDDAAGSQKVTSDDDQEQLVPITRLDMRWMKHPALVARIRASAARIGVLIEQGLGDGPEVLGLSAERHWIQRRRGDAWRSAYRPTPPPPLAKLVQSLAAEWDDLRAAVMDANRHEEVEEREAILLRIAKRRQGDPASTPDWADRMVGTRFDLPQTDPDGRMNPAEHFEAIGGYPAVESISHDAAGRLRLTVALWARDGPQSRWAEEYRYFWLRYTTGGKG